jgi:hypothetical protein
MSHHKTRLQRLELQRNPPQRVVAAGLCTVAHSLPVERKINLAADERVVVDWYHHVNGVVWGRERITKDPVDTGRCCKRGGYLFDVLLELHEACPNCEQVGSRCTCGGTAVTEAQTESPEEE